MSILETLTPPPNPEVSFSKWARQRFSLRLLHIQIERAKKRGWVSEARKLQKAKRELANQHQAISHQLFLRNLIKA